MSKENKIDSVVEEKNISNKKNGKAPTGKIDSFGGMTKDELMNILRLMSLSRQMDTKIMNLLRQGKVFFHIAGSGHEATQVAFGKRPSLGEEDS